MRVLDFYYLKMWNELSLMIFISSRVLVSCALLSLCLSVSLCVLIVYICASVD